MKPIPRKPRTIVAQVERDGEGRRYAPSPRTSVCDVSGDLKTPFKTNVKLEPEGVRNAKNQLRTGAKKIECMKITPTSTDSFRRSRQTDFGVDDHGRDYDASSSCYCCEGPSGSRAWLYRFTRTVVERDELENCKCSGDSQPSLPRAVSP
jgi:hypothetical protein